MMSMINANFSKQDTQVSPPGEALDKENGSDEFMNLIAGLCMPPQGENPAAAVEPDKGIDNNTASMSDLVKPVTSVKTSGTLTLQFLQPVTAGVKPATDTLNLTKDEHAQTQPTADPLAFDPLLPAQNDRTCQTLHLDPFDPAKPLVKDLKTQINKFEEVAALPGSIANANNFSAMAKIKAAAVAALAQAGTQVIIDPAASATDDVPYAEPTHLNNDLFMGAVAELGKERGPRKLSKLISHVSDLVSGDAAEAGPVTGNELAQTSERVEMPKASALLEQIQPKLLQIAAAVANNSKQIMKMRLHPAELGSVEITLEKDSSGTLSAHFKTDNDTAKHLLTSTLDQLRDALQNAGWKIGEVKITTGTADSQFSSASDSSSADTRPQQAKEFSNGQDSKDPGRNADDPNDLSHLSRAGGADRLVSLRA